MSQANLLTGMQEGQSYVQQLERDKEVLIKALKVAKVGLAYAEAGSNLFTSSYRARAEKVLDQFTQE